MDTEFYLQGNPDCYENVLIVSKNYLTQTVRNAKANIFRMRPVIEKNKLIPQNSSFKIIGY